MKGIPPSIKNLALKLRAKDGQFHDTVEMAILKDDWEQIKKLYADSCCI